MTQAAEMLRSAEALSAAGDNARAEAVLRQLLGQQPSNAEALNALAAMVLDRGQFGEAIALLETALKVVPKAPILYSNLAEAHRRAGQPQKAIEYAARALELRPNHIEALAVLGAAYFDCGYSASALQSYDRALALDASRPDFHHNRGNALQRLNRLKEAEAAFRRAIALDPSYADAYSNLAGLLFMRGRFDEAEVACRKGLALAPNDVVKRINLARVLGPKKRADARVVIDQVLRQAPNNADALLVKAGFDLKERDIAGALAASASALEIDPNRADAYTLMGQALCDAGEIDRGIAAHQQAVAIAPTSWDAQFGLGKSLQDLGRFEEARASFTHCRALNPDRYVAYVSLSEVKRFRSAEDPDLAAMERAAANDAVPAEELAYVHFALAKAYDDLGRFSEAGEQMLRANGLKRASVEYDEQKGLRFFERLKRHFDAETIARLRGAGAPSETPIFVFGMPRSGTTLVEQIIASHPDVAGAGELELLYDRVSALRGEGGATFPECVSDLSGAALSAFGEDFVRRLSAYAPGAQRITDKAMSTFFFVGLIHLAMPGAKKIHMTRNAADTCLSCFSNFFGFGHEYSYDLGELGRYYRAYHDLMQHWRDVLPADAFLDVRYEDVIADTENQARRILDFCDLDWDPRVLDFHKNDRIVRTLSAQQVRQPIYGSSVGRWRNYEAMLAPLLAELGDLATPE